MHQTVYVISGNKILPSEARISGEFAYLPLPFGQEKKVKYPHWQPSKADADAEIQRRKLARLDRARKLLATA